MPGPRSRKLRGKAEAAKSNTIETAVNFPALPAEVVNALDAKQVFLTETPKRWNSEFA